MIPKGEKPSYEESEKVAGRLADRVAVAREMRADSTRAFLVAIDGPMAAGKSTLTRQIAAQLESRGLQVAVVHGDDFLNPDAVRKPPQPLQGEPLDKALTYYEHTVNEERMAEMLQAIRQPGGFTGEYLAYNLKEDAYQEPRPYDIKPGTIVLVEGLFLLKEGMRRLFDTSIFMDLEPEQTLARALSRNAQEGNDKIPLSEKGLRDKFNERYGRGFYEFYRERDEPRDADIVVDASSDDFNLLRISAQKNLGAH